jgi:phosphotransferase system enzyme I (PtsI)
VILGSKGKVLVTGTPAAPGIAIGNAFWVQAEAHCLEERCVSDSAAERRRLDEARGVARQQLGEIRDRVEREAGSEEAALFDAHALMLDDPDLLRMVDATVEKESINVEVAWAGAIEHYARQMEALDDERFRARAADVRDVGRRVLRALLGLDEGAWLAVDGPAIILAEDLTPSDTARLDKSKVLGFCTIEGGPTSHTAILAKAGFLSTHRCWWTESAVKSWPTPMKPPARLFWLVDDERACAPKLNEKWLGGWQ